MFKVQEIKTGKVRTVYAVSGTHFMFFEDGVWYWDSIGGYEPVREGNDG